MMNVISKLRIPRGRSALALITMIGCLACSLDASGSSTARGSQPSVKLVEAQARLPVKTAFHKITRGELKGLYRLRIENESDKPLTIAAVVRVSIPVHSQSKFRDLPLETIEAGKNWTINELAAHDEVTLTSEGFAPLKLSVP